MSNSTSQFSESLADQLAHRLTDDLPGHRAHRRAAPGLAYGRHQGPPPSHARQAAVALMIYFRDGAWWLPLTRRPTSIRHHGGQVCLPGGRIEAEETYVEAAVREYIEELGVEPQNTSVCGELTPLYVYASDNRVHPIVVACNAPDQAWQPDPIEVDTVLEVALESLLREDSWRDQTFRRTVKRKGREAGELRFRAPGLQLAGHHVWGATAMILAEFAEVLATVGKGESR